MKSVRIVSAVTLGLLMSWGAPAQETKKEKREAATERVVQGTVTDKSDKFVNGAIVELKDMRSLQVRSFITQQNGEYHFSGLKIDNDYQILGRFSGMTSGWKTLSVFDTRKVPVINLKLDKEEKEKK